MASGTLGFFMFSIMYDNYIMDEVGFEPTVYFYTPVFKTGTMNPSITHPISHK